MLFSGAMKARIATLILVVVGLTSCMSEPEGPIAPDTYFPDLLPQSDIYSLSFSGIETQSGNIINNNDTFRAVWDVVFANYAAGQKPLVPPVDFTQYVVLLASAGSTPTQLRAFRIAMVRDRPYRVEVTVERLWPCNGGLPVVTTPVHMVAIPRVSTQAVFDFVDTAESCP